MWSSQPGRRKKVSTGHSATPTDAANHVLSDSRFCQRWLFTNAQHLTGPAYMCPTVPGVNWERTDPGPKLAEAAVTCRPRLDKIADAQPYNPNPGCRVRTHVTCVEACTYKSHGQPATMLPIRINSGIAMGAIRTLLKFSQVRLAGCLAVWLSGWQSGCLAVYTCVSTCVCLYVS